MVARQAPFYLFPPNHRSTGGTSFHFYYTQSVPRAPRLSSLLFVVTQLSQFLGGGIFPPRVTRGSKRITIHDGRECVFLTILRTILRNTVKNRTRNTRRSRSLTDVHRFSGSGRRTKERKEEEEEYICIYTYKKGRKRGKYHGDHLLLYIIPNVYVSTERIYPEARCLLRTMHVAVVMVSLHSPSR